LSTGGGIAASQRGVEIGQVALLQLRRHACFAEIDAVAAQRHTFLKQPRALLLASGQTAIGSDHAMPGEIVNCGQDVANEARRARIDVAVCADETFRNRADPFGDAQSP